MSNFYTKYAYVMLLGLWLSPALLWADNSNPVVDIKTSKGLITIQLVADIAPVTVNNFLTYLDEGFYEGTLFHRVVDDFVIQGGGFNAELELLDVHAPINLESNEGLSNVRGTIAMARLDAPASASSQFFINTRDNLFLDYKSSSSPGYAVFGNVIDGMDVVDEISAELTGPALSSVGPLNNVPLLPVVIEVIRRREGQLKFADMPVTYAAGDKIKVSLQETMLRESALDLWFAVLAENGRLTFVTEKGFSRTPDTFIANVPLDNIHHSVFELTVAPGLTGRFTLLAIFNAPGADLEDLQHSLRSNIAAVSIEIVE